jgi:WD40 repeat protein
LAAKTSKNQQQKLGKDKKPAAKQQFANKSKETYVFKHKLLSSTLKAHSDVVTGIDFSSNGKYLISCGRGVYIYDMLSSIY